MTRKKYGLLVLVCYFLGSTAVAEQSKTEPIKDIIDKPVAEKSENPNTLQDLKEQNSTQSPTRPAYQDVASTPGQYEITEKRMAELQVEIQGIREEQVQLENRLNQWFASAEGIEEKIMQIGISSFDVTQQIQNSALGTLAILLAVAALGITFAYFDVRRRLVADVESKSKKIIEAERQKIEAAFLNKHIRERLTTQTAIYQSLSFMAWKQYKDVDFLKEPTEYRRNVQNAIILAEKALDHANEMNKIDGDAGNEEENRFAVISAKNNLAYHLASKLIIDDSDIDKSKLLTMAKDVSNFGKQNKTTYPTHWYSWVETYIYACTVAGEDHDKVLAKAELQSLLNDQAVNKEWAGEIAQEYEKTFLSSGAD